MRYIFFACSLLFFPFKHKNTPYTVGSTVICISATDIIYIAGDTKASGLYPGTTKIVPFGTACKVFARGDMIYGIVGFPNDKNLGINIPNIIDTIQFTSDSLEQRIAQIRKVICPYLLQIAKSIEKTNWAYFYTQLANTNMTDLVFGMFEGEKPVIGYIHTICNHTINKGIFITDTSSITYDNSVQLVIGHREAIDSVLTVNQSYFRYFPSISVGLNDIFKYQALKTPDMVNDTVDIVSIMPLVGTRWYQRYKDCK